MEKEWVTKLVTSCTKLEIVEFFNENQFRLQITKNMLCEVECYILDLRWNREMGKIRQLVEVDIPKATSTAEKKSLYKVLQQRHEKLEVIEKQKYNMKMALDGGKR